MCGCFRYSPEQLFAVVADVDLYEDFVPWCQRSTVLWRKNDEAMEAELEIGFRFFVERYISHVTMKHPNLIKVFFLILPSQCQLNAVRSCFGLCLTMQLPPSADHSESKYDI